MKNTYTLSNNISIPNFCYGTSITSNYDGSLLHAGYYIAKGLIKNRKQFHLDMSLQKVVDVAWKHGCRLFDTSRAYGGSEYLLGKILKKYDRSQYMITTKLSNNYQFKGDILGSFEESLKNFHTDYIDLYLIHWPVTGKYIDSWRKIIQLYDEGLCHAIGVCNCNISHLKTLEIETSFLPMVNQFECHPLFTQNELRNYCSNKKIQVMAYTSTGRMDSRLRNTVLPNIAKKYNKSIAQIILRWHQQIGNIPIVNSSNPIHITENIDISDFTLTSDEIEQITRININSRLRYDPENCDFTKL